MSINVQSNFTLFQLSRKRPKTLENQNISLFFDTKWDCVPLLSYLNTHHATY